MRPLRYLNPYIWKYKWRFLLGVLFVTLSNIFAIYPAQVIRQAFDIVAETINFYRLFDGFADQAEFYGLVAKSLLFFGLLVLALALIKGFFTFLMRQTIIIMSRYIEYDLKNVVFEHYQKLGMAFYKRNNTGDLMNRISEDVSRVRMYLGPAIMYTINLAVLFILIIVTMISVNPKLTLYVLTPLPIMSVLVYYVSNIINKRSERVQEQLSRLTTYVQEAFSGIRVIKAYNRETASEQQFEQDCEDYKTKSLRLVSVNAMFFPIIILLIGLSTILTVYIGGQLTITGEVSTGNIAEFVIYVNMLTWPFAAVGWVTSLVQRAAASMERVNEFLHTEPEITNQVLENKPIQGNITFKNVSFTYPDSGIEAVNDVSFEVRQGQSLAIIGRTGSGKSTIASLIERLYDTTSGQVLIDGIPIDQVNLDELRTNIGYVPQDVFLFSETIHENIGFGESIDTSDSSAVEQAAKDAAVYANIAEFSDGFQTRVGERGITLSGGQKQRISIARALVKSPQILIFDDCLSAVDTETEEQILQNLRRIMANKTTIIISHRVSSVQHCDQIIVLDQGKIIEKGSHQSLIDQEGNYFDLFQKQLLEERQISDQ